MYHFTYHVYLLVLLSCRGFLRNAGYIVYTPEEQLLKLFKNRTIWIHEEEIEKEFAKFGKSKSETRRLLARLVHEKKLREMMEGTPHGGLVLRYRLTFISKPH